MTDDAKAFQVVNVLISGHLGANGMLSIRKIGKIISDLTEHMEDKDINKMFVELETLRSLTLTERFKMDLKKQLVYYPAAMPYVQENYNINEAGMVNRAKNLNVKRRLKKKFNSFSEYLIIAIIENNILYNKMSPNIIEDRIYINSILSLLEEEDYDKIITNVKRYLEELYKINEEGFIVKK
ncbi:MULTISPECIES: hypothetical protein [unclassified Fusobacterium]|uniref:hypothetical protein n=1 Tax=unclassified Fusobacterium TaxID=2648384 RepID=UPI001B8CC0F6|nr:MULTISPECIES: hypothetical protein [unclassified Fusobacterium]MBR8701043.1 hypothetical protein [Fusobacterium sp. DD45]MBR8710815.1 hypothetical protein [Fusobacterium sp. DD28]MBR8751407.1 hypothetical protein [Fusobacterium sp. DD26]